MVHLSAKRIIGILERPGMHGLKKKRRLTRDARVVDLVAALRLSQTALTRANLCEVLGRRKARSAVPDLIACLNDESAMVRSDAATALGRIGASSAGTALIHQLENEKDNGVRQLIMIALGAIGYKEAEKLI